MTAAEEADGFQLLEQVVAEDLAALTAFLRAADLTVSGLEHPSVRLGDVSDPLSPGVSRGI